MIKLATVPDCSVTQKSWSELTPADVYEIAKLRTDVFLVEQKVDETELDRRDLEPTVEHLWISDADGAAAYLRVLLDPQPEHRDARRVIGRVVVRKDRRGDGLARILMQRVIEQHGGEPMLLHAQQYIVPLYASFGFEEFGDPYDEAGLPHVSMYRAGR